MTDTSDVQKAPAAWLDGPPYYYDGIPLDIDVEYHRRRSNLYAFLVVPFLLMCPLGMATIAIPPLSFFNSMLLTASWAVLCLAGFGTCYTKHLIHGAIEEDGKKFVKEKKKEMAAKMRQPFVEHCQSVGIDDYRDTLARNPKAAAALGYEREVVIHVRRSHHVEMSR